MNWIEKKEKKIITNEDWIFSIFQDLLMIMGIIMALWYGYFVGKGLF